MDILLPDFSQATFESGQVIDNQYFPLTPGTVLSYQGQIYDTEEIVEVVTEEIGEEIAEEIVEGFGVEEFDDGDEIESEEDLDELADEIESELEDVIEEIVNDVINQFGDDIGEFDPEELAEEITVETRHALSPSGNNEILDDFDDRIIEAIDENLDGIAIEIADEITDVEGDLFATESNQVYVTNETKNILGVETTVIRDVGWDEGILIEDTLDWYAQDTEGNVWYLGEIATNY